MTEAKFEQLKKAEADFEKAIVEAYIKSLPEEIQKLSKKYPEYINTCQNLTIFIPGKGYSNIYLEDDSRIPAKNDNARIRLTSKLSKQRIANEKRNGELRSLKVDIRKTLLSLRTTKTVALKFPEAMPFITIKPVTKKEQAQETLPSVAAIRKALK